MTSISLIDHIVICVKEVEPFVAFYRDLLGAKLDESSPGKIELRFGNSKISVQTPESLPAIAQNTKPGTANLCLTTDEDMVVLCTRMEEAGFAAISPLRGRDGAVGAIYSAHFRDPEGNLVEVGNRI